MNILKPIVNLVLLFCITCPFAFAEEAAKSAGCTPSLPCQQAIRIMLSSFNLIQAATTTGQIYSDYFQLRDLAKDNHEINQILSLLDPFVKTGIANSKNLRNGFSDLTQNLNKHDDGALANILANLIIIEKKPDPKATTPDTLLKDIINYLNDGDISNALLLYQNLPNNYQELTRQWHESAKNSQLALRATKALYDYLNSEEFINKASCTIK